MTAQLDDAAILAIAARVALILREELVLSAADRWPAYMNVETAAAFLDVSPERLRKLQAQRRIPYIQESAGRRVLFARRDLDQWMNSQRQPAQVGDA